MKSITVRNQKEWNALPKAFSEITIIRIESDANVWLSISGKPESSCVVARGSSHVVARGSSHVEAWGSSHVVARGSSHVVARGSSHVEARESSHVEAWESSHVEAWGSSHVVARESSHVEAWESSHVEAWESSHVEAWGSSHVVAWGSVTVAVQSDYSIITLFAFAIAIASFVKNITKKSKTCSVVKIPPAEWTVKGWLERQGIEAKNKLVTIFKRVSIDFKTQEGTPNETLWSVGLIVEHKDWNPTNQECGPGKFHACGRPYFCDEFRDKKGDRYIAIQVAVKDLHAWENPGYPNKIAFRSCKVLHECNRFGEKL